MAIKKAFEGTWWTVHRVLLELQKSKVCGQRVLKPVILAKASANGQQEHWSVSTVVVFYLLNKSGKPGPMITRALLRVASRLCLP